MSVQGIEETEQIAAYLKTLFVGELRGKGVEMPNWPLEFLEECHYAVKALVQATRNTRRTRWSAAAYLEKLQEKGKRCTGQQERIENELAELFPAGKELITGPCLVVDVEGYILLWYLPGLLSPKRREMLWHSLGALEKSLKVKVGCMNWRVNGDYYRAAAECEYKPGTVSFAIAWFQQGMKGRRDMEMGAELRKPAVRHWLKMMGETSAFLGGLLAIMHPSMFKTGMQCIKEIRTSDKVAKREQLEELLEVWTSPYTAASVISNRDTPLHRDNGGDYSSMDLLVTAGRYTMGKFSTPGLGLDFGYPSGTIIGLVGRVVRHGAEASGKRVCFAQYLRENVLKTLGVPAPQWVRLQDLENLCSN